MRLLLLPALPLSQPLPRLGYGKRKWRKTTDEKVACETLRSRDVWSNDLSDGLSSVPHCLDTALDVNACGGGRADCHQEREREKPRAVTAATLRRAELG